ncbi:MAG TPA: hypothetical protein VGS22_18665 [Thermoanaerobaculia bacterium]|jgi:hypothetical protein|nr:hypothetical protein [Thermoanaerobaculia bacterium]
MRHVFAFLAYLALSLVYLRPIWRLFRTHLAPDGGDPLFNLVVLKWGIRHFQTGFAGYWNLPYFFPTPRVTTFSDHLLGPAFAGWLLGHLGIGPIAVYNLLFLVSYAGSAFALYWVLEKSGVSTAGAWIGGLAFAFSSFRWFQGSHLQILLALWIPPLLWTFDRLLQQPTWRRAAAFLAFYALHLSGGLYLAYMAHLPLAILAANRLPGRDRPRWSRADLVRLGTAAVVCAGIAAAFFLPYERTASSEPMRRDDNVIADYAATLASYFTPSSQHALYAGHAVARWERPENALFPGFGVLLLAAWGALEGVRRHRGPSARAIGIGRRATLALLVGIAVVACLAADAKTWSHWPGVPWRGLALPSYTACGVALLLSASTAMLLRRRWTGGGAVRWAEIPVWPRGLLLGGAAAFLLTLPQIYLPLARFVPGLAQMRVPTRFYAFASVAVALLAAYGFDRLGERLPSTSTRRALTFGAMALLAIELAPRPLDWTEIEPKFGPQAVDRWLAEAPEVRAILEVPLGRVQDDIPTMYRATHHGKPLVNGYSGFLPQATLELRRHCCYPLPEAADLALLRTQGVTHVVARTAALRRWQRRELQGWSRRATVRRVWADADAQVFEILADPHRASEPDPFRVFLGGMP